MYPFEHSMYYPAAVLALIDGEIEDNIHSAISSSLEKHIMGGGLKNGRFCEL